MQKCGNGPIVFTAPHSISLLHPHGNIVAAEHVGSLVRDFAKLCGGAFITWSDVEVQRVMALEAPDRSNRDPNFLRDEELISSPWFSALRFLRESMTSLWDPAGAMRATIHVELKGVADPNSSESADCVVNTNAMELKVGKARAEEFQRRVEEHLRPVLQSLGMDVQGEGPGAYGGIEGRNTLTMQSLDFDVWNHCGTVPFSHAFTLGLSRRLRKHLDEDAGSRSVFVDALHNALIGQTHNGVVASSVAVAASSTLMQRTTTATAVHAAAKFKRPLAK